MAKWLDKYEQGGLVLKKKTKDNYGKKPNVNDVKVSAGPGFEGDGYTAQNWKSPAWGGQFEMGGALPGSVGFMYARTQNPAPANGKYTKKTLASAQNGKVLSPDADDRLLLGFNTPDPAFQNVKANAFVPFDRKDFEGIRQNIAGYMNSPLYMERLSKSIPDAENAKDVQQRRLNNLLGIKLNPDYVDDGTHYNANQNRINVGARDFVDNSIIGHELAHGVVPNITNSYGKQNIFAKAANVVGDLFQPYEQFSNSELEKINIPLSGKITTPNFDYRMARKEEHYKPQGSKASAKTAANETYGDLTGMRQLLLDNGITTEFGQELTPEIFKKAKENKRVINSPTFKRMKLKFKDEDIIKMNNEVAYNDDNAPLDQAQNGKEMSFYQNGLDFKPKSISKKGKKIIKDDMGQWAHPGEVTEIGSPDITMQGVDYPVLGISDTGDTQMMYPDQDYKFDGDKVTEFPMMEKGGWLDKYKAQSGKTAAPYGSLQGDLPEVIVTSSIKDYNIRKLAEQNRETIGPVKPLSEYSPEARRISEEFNKQYQDYSKQREKEFNQKYNRDSWDYHLNKLKNSAFTDWKPYAAAAAIYGAPAISSALGLGSTSAALAAPLVNVGGAGVSTGQILSALFAAQAAKGYKDETYPLVAEAIKNPTKENIINATNSFGWNTLNALPFVAEAAPGAKYVANEIGSAVNASKESGLLSNTYKLNPWAETLEGQTQRQIFGDPAYQSFLKYGPTTQPEVSAAEQLAQWNKIAEGASPVTITRTGENMQIAGTTRIDPRGMRVGTDYPFAYFSEGSPWYGPKASGKLSEQLGSQRVIVPKKGANLQFYPAGESSIVINPEELSKEAIQSYAGRRRVLSPSGEAFNPEAFDVFEPNWLRGYKKVPKPVAQGTANASPSNYFSDLIKSGKSYFEEKAGEKLAGAENRAAIAEGNKWSEDWASNPETARKIRQQIIDQKIFGNQNPAIFDRINTPQTREDYRYLTTYKPGATEFPLADQKKDLINTILGKNRYSTSMIHGDNLGVSYRHSRNPLLDMDDYIPGVRSSGPGTWISRTPRMNQAARKSVTVHENTHDWLRDDALERLGYKDEIESHLSQEAMDASTKWIESGYNTKKHYTGYLADPTEVHARIMEVRNHFGLTPTDKVTPELAEGMLEVIRQGKIPSINKKFADIFSSPKGVAQLFNKLPALAPVAVGVGAAATALPKEQKNGGWLNKYK